MSTRAWSIDGGVARTNAGEPVDMGVLAWTGDVTLITANAGLTSGRIHWNRVRLLSPATVTGAFLNVGVAGSTLTSGQNLMGVYDASGTQLAVSVDQTTAWTTTGFKQAAFTAPVNLGAGEYLVSWLSVGTTPPQISRFQNSVNVNGALTVVSTLRARRSSGTANTALPATVNWAADAISDGTLYWAGLY